ncbi:MAG: aconitase X catalytic domain-containing protein [Canidatus Methanoxibalbensis ujae]|nr:aconitase X catalytic domain-containing protein [Candidatus Methanoxibalbensis ujae]MCW7078507.1 aconitase X catalytic domain-containing protein [Candidatus Methanoxibalbensis ujae]
MYLTKDEERAYDGEYGWTLQKAMQILVTIGDLNNAERLIEIESAHVSGASYKTIGDAYEFIARLDGRVAVRTTLNPIGMDTERWREMGISEDFARKQLSVLAAYKSLGISAECTCIPYELSQPKGHIAWSESSAVIFANSVIGARTNMEGAPSALAAALVGKTPLYGLHISENRAATVKFRVNAEISDADFGAFGMLIGEITRDRIPLIELRSQPSVSELKQLSAGIGATGAVGMFHVKGITPEAELNKDIEEVIDIESSDIMCYDACCEPDVIAIGCPHCGISELKQLYEMLRREQAHAHRDRVRCDFFVFTARSLIRSSSDPATPHRNTSSQMTGSNGGINNETERIVEKIERFGVKVFCDTCFVVSPAFERFSCVMTNSGKLLRYAPLMRDRNGKDRNRKGAEVILKSTEECVRYAFHSHL